MLVERLAVVRAVSFRDRLLLLRGTLRFVVGSIAFAALNLLCIETAVAQGVMAAPPPVFATDDANGVNLVSGAFNLSSTDLTIGDPGAGGLTYRRVYLGDGWRDYFVGTINSSGSTFTVSFGGTSETFINSSGTFSSDQARGSSLSFDSIAQRYTYITSDGSEILFDKSLAINLPFQANEGRVIQVKSPKGEILKFTYSTNSSIPANRLQSVTNNFGYHLKFEYSSNTLNSSVDLPHWSTIIKVTAINEAYEYCSPTANSCTFSMSWPSVNYGLVSGTTLPGTKTDNASRVTTYAYTSGRITSVTPPSGNGATSITYASGTGRVTGISVASGPSFTYSYSDSGSTRTLTITDSASQTRTVVSNLTTGRVTSDTDGAGRTTSFLYDTAGHTTRITQPDGNYTQYAYDGRGNVTATTRVPKSGSGLSNITTSAVFPSSCTSPATPATCNKPTSRTDERGNTTDFTYDTGHGGVLTTTLPAPASGLARPQSRFTYSAYKAWYKDSSLALVESTAPPIHLMYEMSACITGTSCNGTTSELQTTIIYGATSTANNLVPTLVTTGAGDASLVSTRTFTYDTVGNIVTIDGPQSGTVDTVRPRYDAIRRPIGRLGNDPDGPGDLKTPAMRVTYDADGNVTAVESGEANSEATDLTSFQADMTMAATYNTLGQKTSDSLVKGGIARSKRQYSYDAIGRLQCSASRVNSGYWSASACSFDGPATDPLTDQITSYTYTAASQVATVTRHISSSATSVSTVTYGTNGQVATVSDGNGNLTTYEYDGFNRRSKVRYPNASSGTSSSTTDYEEFTYDAGSNVTNGRRRDGQTYTVTYDALGRPATDWNGVTYGYDNLNRATNATPSSGPSVAHTWDALGNHLSETGGLGTVSYQYDVAGRRTRMTWPDNFYITYDYSGGGLTAIQENGNSTNLIEFGSNQIIRASGDVTTFTQDDANRIASLAHSGSSVNHTIELTYNAEGQILTRTGSNSSFESPIPSSITRNYSVNGLNQLITSGSLTLTHDGRGNLSSDGVNSYSYDKMNRLSAMGSTATLTYDPAGRLYETTGAATTRFLYDGSNLIGEYNSSGTLLRRYIPGVGKGAPLVWFEGTGASDPRYFITDERGSVIAVTGSYGYNIATNTYDEYGVPGSSNAGRFQYTGKMWIPEVGLYHLGARAYSPTLGRFLQPDPVGYQDGLNLYAYAGNDPVNRIDPTGTCTQYLMIQWLIEEPTPEQWADGSAYEVLMSWWSPDCYDLFNPIIPIDIDIDIDVGGGGVSSGNGGGTGAPLPTFPVVTPHKSKRDPCIDQVARWAAEDIRGRRDGRNVEYGAAIFLRGGKYFFLTMQTSNSPTGIDHEWPPGWTPVAIIHSHPYDSNVPDGTRQLSDEDRFNYRNLSRADNNFIAYLVDPRPQEQGNTGIVAFRGREYQGPTPVGAATCNVAVNGA